VFGVPPLIGEFILPWAAAFVFLAAFYVAKILGRYSPS
jgi:hypothetical protein